MATQKRKLKEDVPKAFSESSEGSSNKRACLNNLPGNTVLSADLYRKLSTPAFISSLEVKYWKLEASLVESYFKYTAIPESSSKHMMTVLVGAMRRISKASDVDVKIKNYCDSLVKQFQTSNSMNRFLSEYNNAYNIFTINEQEEMATEEARITSRVLTTIEAKLHKDKMKERLDNLFNESDDEEQEETVAEDNYVANENAEIVEVLDDQFEDDVIENPFLEEEAEKSFLSIVKEKNLYKFQPPSNNIVSPHKPIIQATDISVLKEYFDICISTSNSKSSKETKAEYDLLMSKQKEYYSLKLVLGDVFNDIMNILDAENPNIILEKASVLSSSNSFVEFVKFALIDYVLNLKRIRPYKPKDERTIYCEIFIPIFKSFGNCTGLLSYQWCEKKASGADYIWLVSNDFEKKRKDNLKLLDGIGKITDIENLNYLLMESSGYQNESIVSHSLNDTLKNIKNAHDNLKYFISHYRNASFTTVKKIHLFSCQIIENKITLIKYFIQSPKKWSVIECRSASVPTKISDSLQYMKVFELFAFLYDDIKGQKDIIRQLEKENLGLIPVDPMDTVSCCLL